ncbi:hypothetical protein FB451DRAFT_1444762 [Mycena latifolia]|nr:hypothetical protein FB451DRAFT_1444762 [Mycena latifolia]
MAFPLLANVTQTRAIGASETRPNTRTFNDMVEIGEFPVNQRIEAIRSIQVFGSARVEGIHVAYRIEGGDDHPVLHGRDSGLAHEVFEIGDNDYLAGAYGLRTEEGGVGSISFVVFESDGGRVEIKGQSGQPPSPGTPFSTFGDLIAFAGTQENAFGLRGLSFLKIGLQNQLML